MITSFRHDRQKRERRRLTVIGAVAVLAILLLLRGPVSGFLSGALHFVGLPFWKVGHVVELGFSGVFDGFRDRQRLAEENRRLQDRVRSMEVAALENVSLQDENAMLRERLGRPTEEELLYAIVLADPGMTAYDTLVLDVGTQHGIVPGLRVYAEGSYAIGEITEVYRNTSITSLYSSPGIALDVRIGTSTVPAVAHGQGGGNFVAQLPKSVPVAIGDAAVIPSLGSAFAAIVDGVDRPESSSFQTLYFRLPITIAELSAVFVGIPTTTTP